MDGRFGGLAAVVVAVFIQLTSPNGEPIYFNIDQIVAFRPALTRHGKTEIVAEGGIFGVRESLDEIRNRIDNGNLGK